jgi:hypothetical protein
MDVACIDCGHDITAHIDRTGDRAGHCISGDHIEVPVPRKDGLGNCKRLAHKFRPCHCWRDKDAVAHPENYVPKLKPGDHCRSIQHPEIEGVVVKYEYHDRGWLSPIPYLISWDHPDWAYGALGMLGAYASDRGVEAIPESAR